EDLKDDADGARKKIEARLAAREKHKRFIQHRDDAIFQATLASGEGSGKNLQATREKIGTALALVGLSTAGDEEWVLGSSFGESGTEEMHDGAFVLLMARAEAVWLQVR